MRQHAYISDVWRCISAKLVCVATRLALAVGLTLTAWATISRVGIAQLGYWQPQGPGPNTLGQVENILNREVVGAINAVAPHPVDENIVYIGAANGGIWRTGNAMAVSPTWSQQTDDQGSLSIGALEFDPTDPTHQTLVAGTGRFSSFAFVGGARIGLYRTTDGGATWMAIDGGGTLQGLNISGVAPRGSTIVISVNAADGSSNTGIWRSTDTGDSWTRISGAPGSGLLGGAAFDLASDPTDPARLYTNAGASGLFRSTDTGATWSKISNAAMDGMLSGGANVEIAVGRANNVYVAIVRSGRLAGVFRSGNGGLTWTATDVPSTHPGRQGNIHLSIAADSTDANVVYLGGDRQASPFPNAFGARDFSGILFRGDASRPAGSQFVHLTHSRTMGPAGGGTISNSAPHADSRDMDIAVNGVLIEVDDGGIYRRTNPRTNNGDWFSMNGDIQTTEFHAVAWDANADIVIGGAQDTGTPEQIVPANARFRSVATADGGVVAVDDTSTPGLSTRYSSFQGLRGFRRRVYTAANVLQSQVFPSKTVLAGGSRFRPQFYTPIELNNVDANRLILGGSNSVYESLDKADTIMEIGPGIRVNGLGRDPIGYGATGNADMLYVGSGSNVFVRTGAHPAPLSASATYPGGFVDDLAIDPGDPQTAFVVDADQVFRTTNAGTTWSDVTGNLGSFAPGRLRSVAFSNHDASGAVAVGTDLGVFVADGPSFSTWRVLGAQLPKAPVFHLEYDAADDVLLAGTLGRGAWTINMRPSLPVATKWGFVWADNATANSYTPDATYSYNSSGGPITVTRSGTGRYAVRFAGLGGAGTAGGHVQATAYGSSNHTAKLRWWSSSGADVIAHIRCFDASGTPVDSQFTVLVHWPPPGTTPAEVVPADPESDPMLADALIELAPETLAAPGTAWAGRMGFVWANRPTASNYTPNAAYAFNADGGPVTISRRARGRYVVRFTGLGGMGRAGGNVQVTAYGSSSHTAKVRWWSSSGSDLVARVRCFDSSGTLADARFTMLVVWPPGGASPSGAEGSADEGMEVRTPGAEPMASGSAGGAGKMGFAWADRPAEKSYTPRASYSFNSSGGAITTSRSGTGQYLIRFAGLGGGGMSGGNVQVTAYGSDGNSAQIRRWTSFGSDFVIQLRCFDPSGARADSRYAVLVNWPPAAPPSPLAPEPLEDPMTGITMDDQDSSGGDDPMTPAS